MPMYEYRCNDCGKEFEELVLSEEQVVACPGCKSEKTAKLLSCCRFRTGGDTTPAATPMPSSGGCAGCSGGDCSSCS